MGKPLSIIAEELNNVLTVVAMCADEMELGTKNEALADIRDAVRRGALLTQLLSEHASLEPASAPAISNVVATTGPTVVVVEVEPALRHGVRRGLDGRGWRVLAESSIEAVMAHLESMRAVDLLVIDTSGPSRRFASQVVERYPGAAVLYTGGYMDDEPLRRALPSSDVSLLCRPFNANHLVDRIDQVIARRRR